MTTVCLKLRFHRHPEIEEILGKVKVMEQRAVNWLIRSKKTSLSSVHSAFYFPFRQLFPQIHCHWITSSLKTATSIVHQFNKRKRKGKAKRPKLKKAFVSVSPSLFNVSWDGKRLRVTIKKKANDLNPIILSFSPHHKYCAMLDKWKRGEGKMGQITLTLTSIIIPLKFPSVPTYQPLTVIGIDSNENSLDYFNPSNGELGRGDREIPCRGGRLVKAGQGAVGAPCCPFSDSMEGGMQGAVTTGRDAVTLTT